jgi:adenylate kinase
MQRGELVPDELILKIIRERIAQEPRETRFLFDGFPRTLPQAEGLDSLIRELKACFLGAFLLEVPQELLIRRLTGRRVCRDCGAVYHILYSPPQTEGVCDQCGGTDLYQRADDSKETILNRLKVFDRQTRPVIEYYREQSRLFAVDASDDPEAIFRRFSAVLKDASR